MTPRRRTGRQSHRVIESCKLNSVDPQAYMTSTLSAIVNGHKQSQIEGLLPWNYLAG